MKHPDTNKTTSSLFNGGAPITTKDTTRDFSPVFNPADSSVVFFSSTRNNGVSNLFYTNVDGSSTAVQLTNFPIDISNIRLTPSYIIFTAEIYDACGVDFGCTAQQDEWWSSNPNSGIVFNSLFVRHWDHLSMPGKSSQIFTLQYTKNADGSYSIPASVKPTQIQKRMPRMNVPVPPDGGVEQIAVKSSTYDRIAFTGDLIQHDTAWSTGWRIYEVVVDPNTGIPTKTPACLTCQGFPKIRTTNPKYDPTGHYLSFLAMERAGFEADRLHIELFKVGQRSGPSSPVTLDLDRSIADYAWSSDGKSILAAYDEDGEERVYAINIGLGTTEALLLNGTNNGLKVKGSVVYYTHTAYDTPADIRAFTFDTSTGKMQPGSDKSVTQLNPSVSQLNLDPGTKFYFQSPGDGSRVQGWFFKPNGWTPETSKNWPFVLLVHGGPQGAWNSGWSYRWNPQLWAQHGYAVAMINPHGSTGFGQKFCDAVSGNWGGIPFQDLMAGVSYVLAQNPWIDSRRLSACGASYGGFMINWFQGNAPTRFSSLVVHDGLFDVPISYGATDELWFPEWEFKGTPWTNSSGYQIYNPARFADKWQTPMLVVHGGKDYRVDLAHGLAAFTTLQRKNIPSKFLFYPEENHWVSRPSNSVQWYSEVLGWLDTYTKHKTN